MISQLEGIVTHKDLRYLVLDVAGIGYKVNSTSNVINKTTQGDILKLWTYLAVRENALDLYGFSEKDDKDFFELLISISGIGPKTALAVLNTATAKTLKQAVFFGDTSHLIKVSGIGKKIAEKIVLELKGKVEEEEESHKLHLKEEIDSVEALRALGYGRAEARDALKKVSKDVKSTGDRIKNALKILSS